MKTFTTSKCITIHIKDDHVVHVIKTGFTRPQLYHVIHETPYDHESGSNMKTMDDICKIFGIAEKRNNNKI